MKQEQFPENLAALVQAGAVNYHTARFLNALSAEDCATVYPVFSLLRFNTNTQKEMVEWLHDVMKRDGLALPVILETLNYPELEKNDKLNIPQKATAFRNQLFRYRFPQVAEYLDGLKKVMNGLKLPEQVKVRNLSALEENQFRMELDFTSSGELKTLLIRLLADMENPEWKAFSEYLDR